MSAYMSICILFGALSVLAVVTAVFVPEIMAAHGHGHRATTVRLAAICVALAMCLGPVASVSLLRSQGIELRRNGLSQALSEYWNAVRPEWPAWSARRKGGK